MYRRTIYNKIKRDSPISLLVWRVISITLRLGGLEEESHSVGYPETGAAPETIKIDRNLIHTFLWSATEVEEHGFGFATETRIRVKVAKPFIGKGPSWGC